MDQFDIIMNGIGEMQSAFLKVLLEPPTTIILKSPQQGHCLLSIVRNYPNIRNHLDMTTHPVPVESADNKVYMQLKLADIKVWYPATPIIPTIPTTKQTL